MTKPKALQHAEWIEALALRYHATPGQIMREPRWLFQHVQLLHEATK